MGEKKMPYFHLCSVIMRKGNVTVVPSEDQGIEYFYHLITRGSLSKILLLIILEMCLSFTYCPALGSLQLLLHHE